MENLTFWEQLGVIGLIILGRELLLWFIGVDRITDRLDAIKKLLEK